MKVIILILVGVLMTNIINAQVWSLENPVDAEGIQYKNMIDLYQSKKDYNSAFTVLQAAIQKYPDVFYFSNKYFIISYLEFNNTNLSLKTINNLVNSDFATDSTLFFATQHFYNLKVNNRAEEIAARGISKFPTSYLLSYNYREILRSQDSKAAIGKEIRRFVQEQPNNYNALEALFKLTLNNNQIQEAWIYGELLCLKFPFISKTLEIKKELFKLYKDSWKGKSKGLFIDGKRNDKNVFEIADTVKQDIPKVIFDNAIFIYKRDLDTSYCNYVLFINDYTDYKRLLVSKGHFESYYYWLFGLSNANLEYQNYINEDRTKISEFLNWLKSNILFL